MIRNKLYFSILFSICERLISFSWPISEELFKSKYFWTQNMKNNNRQSHTWVFLVWGWWYIHAWIILFNHHNTLVCSVLMPLILNIIGSLATGEVYLGKKDVKLEWKPGRQSKHTLQMIIKLKTAILSISKLIEQIVMKSVKIATGRVFYNQMIFSIQFSIIFCIWKSP